MLFIDLLVLTDCPFAALFTMDFLGAQQTSCRTPEFQLKQIAVAPCPYQLQDEGALVHFVMQRAQLSLYSLIYRNSSAFNYWCGGLDCHAVLL